jgi:hypothetical protein
VETTSPEEGASSGAGVFLQSSCQWVIERCTEPSGALVTLTR